MYSIDYIRMQSTWANKIAITVFHTHVHTHGIPPAYPASAVRYNINNYFL